ncbi:MAG: glycosyltransferase, partial [Nitrospiria bacterium]
MFDLGIIIPELAKYGGAERVLVECVRRWQHKHKITIYSTKLNEEFLREHGISKDVKLVIISPYFEGPHSMVLNCILLPKIWENEIGVHDIYHTHLWPTHLLDRHPMVWYPHEPLRILHDLKYNQAVDVIGENLSRNIHIYPKYNYDKLVDVMYEAYMSSINSYDKLGNPERIVANSRYTAGYLEEVYDRPVKDIVYPGVNIDDFIYTPPRENIVITVGQLWPHKRVKLIIESIKFVEDVQLYIVGNGPEKENLKEIASNLGLSDRVFFLEGLSNLELQIIFSRCLAVVFAPVKEPFGIVALEAMAAGKPLIAVNEGGFTEVVDDLCAFLVSSRPTEIAEKIRFLKDNKNIAEKMGLAGLRKVKDYTWDRCAEELLHKIEMTYKDWNKNHRITLSSQKGNKTLFGVQYYCWYGEGMGSRHWNDSPELGGVTDMPSNGYYNSSTGVIIEEHLRILDNAGVDFLILNLHIDNHGVNGYELSAIETIFAIAEKKKSSIRFAIQFCIYDAPAEKLSKVFKMVRKIFSKREKYLKSSGKPVVFLFWTGLYDGNKRFVNFLDEN